MQQAKRLWALGAVLLLLSAYPLFLQAREASTLSQAEEEYVVKPAEGATRVQLKGEEIALTDGAADTCRGCATAIAPVQTLVNGHPYSSETPVAIAAKRTDGRRYGSWIGLATVTEKRTGATFLAAIQRLRPAPAAPVPSDVKALVFRLLLVGADGSVHAETFPFTHRASPSYRTLLVSRLAPPGSGVLPQWTQPWLGAAYPLFFPWTSSLVGVILLAYATRLARRARS
jgi:hypothetical protein